MKTRKNISFVIAGQECKVKLTYRGATTIALIVIGKNNMTIKDRCDRVYCGTSTCHPGDTYDLTLGIKQACRSALGISDLNDCNGVKSEKDKLRASIYREIRKVLNQRTSTTEYVLRVETIFEPETSKE